MEKVNIREKEDIKEKGNICGYKWKKDIYVEKGI